MGSPEHLHATLKKMSLSTCTTQLTPVYDPYEPDNEWDVETPLKNRRCDAEIPAEGKESSAVVSTSMESVSEHGVSSRVQWGSKYEFILSHIGFCIGLGNVWRFPYVCYKNGGGAFFIPYVICLLTTGIPIVFLEIALGQYFATGGISCWDISPVFRGVGYATTTVVFWLNIYYIVVLAWGGVYLVYCFAYIASDLPWTTCNNAWNTVNCLAPNYTAVASGNVTLDAGNATVHTDPAVEFWEKQILNISGGIGHLGGVQWKLAVALLIVWIVCYFCVWKGVKSSGKVVYFTALFPYVMLIILIFRGVTLPGAMDGLKYYLTPNLSKLKEPGVWIDAGTQIFFSYAVALGSLTALGSYNSFTYNCYKHSLYLCACDTITSFFAGFAVFTVLGFMAHELGVSIDNVAESGPGLAFIVYPKAAAQMPGGVVWAILFFIMLLLLGLDSQFVAIEGFVTALVDVYPKVFRKGYRKEIFVASVCFLWYLIGLLTITEGGMYVFQLFDYYSASGLCLLWIAFWECVVVGWFYGADRFYDNIQLMIGYRISPWMKWGWQYAGPSFTAIIFLFSIIKYEPLVYNRLYQYPMWAQIIGYLLALSSMMCIPGYMLYKICQTPGLLKQRWRTATTACIPDRPEAKKAKKVTSFDLLYINGEEQHTRT